MTNYCFSDYESTADLGFFTMHVTSKDTDVVFCGGSKELKAIQKYLENGSSIDEFKSYIA